MKISLSSWKKWVLLKVKVILGAAFLKQKSLWICKSLPWLSSQPHHTWQNCVEKYIVFFSTESHTMDLLFLWSNRTKFAKLQRKMEAKLPLLHTCMGLIAYLCLWNKTPGTFNTLSLSDIAFGTYEIAVSITSSW